ncbi:MAG: PQQ-binding-like beta-propeller repeat protein [Candidatus Brocadiia bacterium]
MAGVSGGLVVHLGCGDGKLTAALRASDRLLVHGLEADAGKVEEARAHIQSLGLCGPVSVEQWSGSRLPYTDNLVDLLVAEKLGDVPREEVTRVLAPGGVACVGQEGGWAKTVKPWPDDIDEWTHFLHDASGNAVAQDARVGPPKHIQWDCGPRYCRSHEIDSSISAVVSARGRLFYVLDEGLTGITDPRLPPQWALVARDAFNGVLLWKRPLPEWGWRQWKPEWGKQDWTTTRGQRIRSPITLARRLVAEGDRVYVTLGCGAPVSVLDAATGDTLRALEGTKSTEEILYTEGTLLACVRQGQETVVALEAESGDVLWQKTPAKVLPLSLAAQDGRLFFHNYKDVVCLNLRTGEERWRNVGQRGRGSMWNTGNALVAHDGVVYFLGPGKLTALAAETGKTLWTGKGGRGPGVANPPDLFVADGLVWWGRHTDGRHPRTGERARGLELHSLITRGHHFRCYRAKATERYLLWTKRGVEFLDLEAGNHMRHDWLRAPCRHGFVPCNGLLYMPSHQCFCYPGVKLSGFNALAATVRTPPGGEGPRLQRGPAFGQAPEPPAADAAGDWPTFRHGPRRTGAASTAVPAAFDRLWTAELGGKLSQPVVAHGRVFISQVDAHRVRCLDAASGEPAWSYIAGGRVDSPPTFYRGLVLFGAADGWVYCLRAGDGELAWRFRAAPAGRRVVSYGRLESAWPVHGSVLVMNGLAYCIAGRSTYLDGGMYLYALEPATGKVVHEGHLEGPYPDIEKDPGEPFDMEGAFSDVLVTDGSHLYVQQIKLDQALNQQEAPRLTNMGDRRVGRHVFSTAGFLDDSTWNRTSWMYSERWPGFYIANQAPKAGHLLVCDETTTYAVKTYTRRNRHSPMFFPGTDGYLLFADDNENEPVLVGPDGKPRPVKWLPDVPKAVGWTLETPAVNRDKGTGFTRARPPKWARWVPVRVRAMVVAGDTLFVAGPPDVLEPEDPLAAFEGRKGAVLWAVAASDGKKLSETRLTSPPVFDGLVAARGRLFLATTDGRLTCMGRR